MSGSPDPQASQLSRWPIATLLGLVFFACWVVGAVTLADTLGPVHWALRALYFVVAGFIWVFPVWWLMLWAAHRR